MRLNAPVPRSYKWGTFQGWFTAAAGLGLFLISPFIDSAANTVAALLVGAALMAMGVGLVARKLYGLILFLVWTVLAIGGCFIGTPYPETFVIVAGWWILPAIFYYSKRWREFSSIKHPLPYADGIPPGQVRSVNYERYSVPEVHTPPPQFPTFSGVANGGNQQRPPTTKPRPEINSEEWYRDAAGRGDSDAQNHLGVMHEHGIDVALDTIKAAQWYRLAANQGHPYAQHNLGLLYFNGRGVGQSDGQAYFWMCLAVSRVEGLEEPTRNMFAMDRDLAASRLRYPDRIEIEKEAERWLSLSIGGRHDRR